MNSVHSTLCFAAKIPYYFFLYFCRYNIFFFFKIDFPLLLLSGVPILQYTFILHILYNYVLEKALEKKCSWSVTILAVVTHIWNPTDDDNDEVPYHYSSSSVQRKMQSKLMNLIDDEKEKG